MVWSCVESLSRGAGRSCARPDEMMRAHRVAVVLLVLLTAGCAILEPRAKEDAPTRVNSSDISAGYALLYALVFQRAAIQLAVHHQKRIAGTQIATRKHLRNVQGHR